MNSPPKFLFDENTGAPFVAVIKSVALLDKRKPCEIAHTIELFGKSAKDPDWIPKIRDENWVVISEDRGRNSRCEDRLPTLCRLNGISHVLVWPALLKRGGQFEKLRALLAVWPDLYEFAIAPLGSRARLKYSGSLCRGFKLDRDVAA